jgi:hypothetical protein
MAFGHILLGSHNFMVTALGSCVKWPLVCPTSHETTPTFKTKTIVSLCFKFYGV